jgi:hypothetical protein
MAVYAQGVDGWLGFYADRPDEAVMGHTLVETRRLLAELLKMHQSPPPPPSTPTDDAEGRN